MDESVLEIREHEGEGYKALVDYDSWRVAILRLEDGLLPEHQTTMERHVETDEVFVLTKGKGILIMGGNRPDVSGLDLQIMEIGKIYNIKKNAWHTVSLSSDASVIIVENRDTDKHNSEYVHLSVEQQQWILKVVRQKEL
jgi:hypothetical protein